MVPRYAAGIDAAAGEVMTSPTVSRPPSSFLPDPESGWTPGDALHVAARGTFCLRRAAQHRAPNVHRQTAPMASLTHACRCQYRNALKWETYQLYPVARLQGAGLGLRCRFGVLLHVLGRQSHGQALPSWRGLQPASFCSSSRCLESSPGRMPWSQQAPK